MKSFSTFSNKKKSSILRKIKFFLQTSHNSKHIKNSRKISKNLIFDWAE